MAATGDPTRRNFLTGHLRQPPAIAIGAGCLAKQRIVCQSCADVCAPRAIRFRPRIGGVPVPDLIVGDCTLCGACISACPVSAIALADSGRDAHR